MKIRPEDEGIWAKIQQASCLEDLTHWKAPSTTGLPRPEKVNVYMQVLELFLNTREAYSSAGLARKLDYSRESIRNALTRIREEGYNLRGKWKGHQKFYWID